MKSNEIKELQDKCKFKAKVDEIGILHVLDLYALRGKETGTITVTNHIDYIADELIKELQPSQKEPFILYGTDARVSKFYVEDSKFEVIDIKRGNSDRDLVDKSYYLEMLAMYK